MEEKRNRKNSSYKHSSKSAKQISDRKRRESLTLGGRSVDEFRREREALNEIVFKHAGLQMKRFFNLDSQSYAPGALPKKTKELLGLVASLVLRCDDCVLYHLIQCRGLGVTDEELEEALNIGLIVGGSITIPHMRRAFRSWDEMKGLDGKEPRNK